jgi:hypothetical protein
MGMSACSNASETLLEHEGGGGLHQQREAARSVRRRGWCCAWKVGHSCGIWNMEYGIWSMEPGRSLTKKASQAGAPRALAAPTHLVTYNGPSRRCGLLISHSSSSLHAAACCACCAPPRPGGSARAPTSTRSRFDSRSRSSVRAARVRVGFEGHARTRRRGMEEGAGGRAGESDILLNSNCIYYYIIEILQT